MRRNRKEGINFLNDRSIAEKIVGLCNFSNKDVLEIGPGLGQLTEHIKNYNTLTLIEKNEEFVKRLRTMYPQARVILGDALKVEWPSFQIFISNMPYSISTPLLEKLWNSDFKEGIVTIQREVADRITAHEGNKNYSRLSIMMQLKFSVEREFDVAPSKFTPSPKVFSTVLKLEKKGEKVPAGFDQFLKILFSQRRKKVKNILHCDAFGDKRPEELTLRDMLDLFDKFNEQQRSL